MQEKMGFINVLMMLLVVALDLCYATMGGLWLKAVASASFVLLGVINLIYALKCNDKNKKFCLTMVIGLFVAMLGDIVLNLHFMYGAILFAIGHIFYFVAFCFLSKFKATDLIYGAVLSIVSAIVILFVPIFDFGGIVMQLLCLVYALIISFMVGKTVANFVREKTLFNLILVVGSVLFFFSDLMLLFDVFAQVSRLAGVMCLATYYPAQALLAYSIFANTKQQEIK